MNITHRSFNAEEALAQGAIAAGVRLAASYPGSPGIGVMNALVENTKETGDIYVEWSVNERVALEIGIGASIGGSRSLVCVKSVGMNVLLDPLMTLNLTGIHGGLVILLGDDPGAYGSQNEQDTRLLAHLTEIPLLEPSAIDEGFAMMRDAFDLSERFNTAVVLRITRSFTQINEPWTLQFNLSDFQQVNFGLVREPYRFVPYPGNAVELHREQHKRLDEFERWAVTAVWDQLNGSGTKGILAAGFCYQKLQDVIAESIPENIRILKLSTLYPLPKDTITQFLAGCDEVLVLEESDAFIENELKVIAHNIGSKVKVYGKQSGHLPIGDELLRWQVQATLEKFLPGFKPTNGYSKKDQVDERPGKKNHCADSPNEEILALLKDTADELGLRPILIADPGCWVKVAGDLDGKFSIGSAVAVASGLIKSGVNQPVVALFGDSAFFHSALPAICNAHYNNSTIFMLMLNNSGAMSTGRQPTPATGRDALGKPAPRLNIVEIAKVCGLSVKQLPSKVSRGEIKTALSEGLLESNSHLLILDTP